MKKIMGVVLAGVISMASFQANAESSVLTYLKDYGLPCAAGFLGGMLASKDHGAAIGMGVCLGVGTSTYLQSQKAAEKMRDEDFRKFQKMMDEAMEKNNEAQSKKTDSAIATMEEKQAAQLEATRQVMKEVIAERLALIGEDVKGDVRRYVERADFMQDLEKKVMMKIKEEVKTESKLRQKETVEDAVDEVMRQVILKKVGVPEGQ